jgi:hypothetical protein
MTSCDQPIARVLVEGKLTWQYMYCSKAPTNGQCK